jgi:glycosyltransferase involved in cell wall biosynthesis
VSALSLVIPVFNEQGNLLPLAGLIEAFRSEDLLEVLWVNNGSEDGSEIELRAIAARYAWAKIYSIKRNQGYGGGILEGVRQTSAQATHIGWLPADGQVAAKDVFEIWEKVKTDPTSLHKGLRLQRADSASQRWVSVVYSCLTRWILGIPVRDTNGLPKIFPAALLREGCFHNPEKAGFVFDASMLFYVSNKNVRIVEHPVAFLKRHSGVSSWSGRRLVTYWAVTRALVKMRWRFFFIKNE